MTYAFRLLRRKEQRLRLLRCKEQRPPIPPVRDDSVRYTESNIVDEWFSSLTQVACHVPLAWLTNWTPSAAVDACWFTASVMKIFCSSWKGEAASSSALIVQWKKNIAYGENSVFSVFANNHIQNDRRDNCDVSKSLTAENIEWSHFLRTNVRTDDDLILSLKYKWIQTYWSEPSNCSQTITKTKMAGKIPKGAALRLLWGRL